VLYNLIQDGVQVHYILGNHEVMIGRFLNEFGFKVHNQNATLTIEGKRVFLAHGHMIDRRLWTTIWQKLLTSKVNHALYSLIHPDVGVFLAQGIAFLSRKQRRTPHAAALLELYARSKFEYADIVMLAHSHIPVLKKFPGNKYYINTGDWIEHFTYGVIDKSGISLRRFKTPLQ
jgi:UDP-2,3-diacylglucosamine hydrolase